MVATIPVGCQPTGVVVTPDGTRAYVTNSLDNTVSVIDTATNTVVATLPVGLFPQVLGICSNGNALLAAGLTFKANTSGALNCTLASGPTGSPGPVFTGGTLQICWSEYHDALPISLQSAGGTVDTNGNNAMLSGAISGPGGLTKIGAGTLTLSGRAPIPARRTSMPARCRPAPLTRSRRSARSRSRAAPRSTSHFNQTIGSLAGAGNVTLGSAMLTTGNDNTSTMFSGMIAGTGGLTKVGTGTLTLSGSSSYSGATEVNAGTLQAGAINAFSPLSAFTVASGATLGLANFNQMIGSLAARAM